MVALAGQGVIQRQQTAKHPGPWKRPAIMGKQEAQRIDQPRRLAQHLLALTHRSAGQAELALGDITQAAMHHLR